MKEYLIKASLPGRTAAYKSFVHLFTFVKLGTSQPMMLHRQGRKFSLLPEACVISYSISECM